VEKERMEVSYSSFRGHPGFENGVPSVSTAEAELPFVWSAPENLSASS
jgi:hypothetical protein